MNNFNDVSSTETKTVAAVFDDYESARNASRNLVSAGVAENNIDIQSNYRTGAAGYGAGESEQSQEGGFSGWLHRVFGGSDDETGHYAEAVRRGSTVLTVTAPEAQAATVADILNQAGAVDIDRRVSSWRESGYKNYDESAEPYTWDQAASEREKLRSAATGTATGEAIPVIQEELQVGKREVRRGGVRIYSRVVDTPVEEQINLREERVRVERRPVNRSVTPEDLNRLKDQTIEVTEMAEEAVVSKRARVTEEVVVGKESTQRTETVRDSVRSTEIQVDPLQSGASVQSGSYGTGYDEGYRYASDARFKGKSWSDVESDLRSDYTRSNPNSTWDEVKSSVRAGWDKMTGK